MTKSQKSFNLAKKLLFAICFMASIFTMAFGLTLTNKSKLAAYAAGETYSVLYNLTGVKVVDEELHTQAINGEDFTINLQPNTDEGFLEVDESSLVVNIAGEQSQDFTFNFMTGALTVSGQAIIGDVEISAQGLTTSTTFTAVTTSSNGTIVAEQTAQKGVEYVATFTANAGYILYPTIASLSVGGTSLLENTNAFTYDRQTGTVTILAEYVTGDIEIVWNAQPLVLKTSLDNATCVQTGSAITLGTEISLTLVANTYYNLPQTIKLTYATFSGEQLPAEAFSYNALTGQVTVLAEYVTDVICVSAEAQVKTASVTYNVQNVTYEAYSESYTTTTANYGKTWYVKLYPTTGYRLDYTCLSIQMGQETLEATTHYTLGAVNSSGYHTLQIKKEVITDDIVITIDGISTKVEVEYDLKNISLSSEAITEWTYDTAGLNMTLVFNDATGYQMPVNTDRTFFKVYADGVELESGWSLTKDYKLTIYKPTTKCQKLTIVAHAQPIDYTITLNAGSNGSLNTTSVTYNIETTQAPQIETPIVENGYEFIGWQVTAVEENSTWIADAVFDVSLWQEGNYGNISLTAQYEIVDYTITILSGDHGICDQTPITYNVQTPSISLPQVSVDNHYSLEMWQVTTAEGSWEVGQTFEYARGVYGNVSITPIYGLTKYIITLDPTFRGTLSGETSLEYTIGTEQCPTIESPTPTEAYTFTGWIITNVVESSSWTENQAFDASLWQTGSFGDITLTAQYQANTYTITVLCEEHGNVSASTVEYSPDMQNIELPIVTVDDHYSFAGWQVTTAGGSWQEGDGFEYVQGTYGDITITAKIEVRNYTITLNADDKGTLETAAYTYTYFDIEAPQINEPTPFNDGYGFSHWQVEQTSGSWVAGDAYAWTEGSYGDIAIKAIYTPFDVKYTITYYFESLEGSSYILNNDYTAEETAKTWDEITVTPLSVVGFTFNEEDQRNVITAKLVGDGNDTFKIFYTRDVYTVTYVLTDLTAREATVNFKKYSKDEIRYGNQFYVYLDPLDGYHLLKDSVKFKINDAETEIEHQFTESSNRLFIDAGKVTGNLTIKAEAENDTFNVEYDLTGVKLAEQSQGLTTAKYKTNFKVYFEMTANPEEYDFPTDSTVSVEIDDTPIASGYNASQAGGFIEFFQAAVVGNIKIVAKVSPKNYTVTIKGQDQTKEINYNVETDIELKPIEKTGYRLAYYILNPTNYNLRWQERYPDNKITEINVEKGLVGNVTLRPYYTIINYNITLDAGEQGTLESNLVAYNIETVDEPEFPAIVPNAGYKFTKWQVTGAAGSWELGDYAWSTGNHGDITLKASYELQTYNITFDAGEKGSIQGENATYNIETVAPPTMPVVTPVAGYRFDKWVVTSNDGNWDLEEFSWVGGKYGNITVTAQYVPIEYTILYKVDVHGWIDEYSSKYTIETVEEPQKPQVVVDKGYHIDRWVVSIAGGSWQFGDYAWSAGNYGDFTITAKVIADTDTPYTVLHFFENLDGEFVVNSNYTQLLKGETGKTATATPLNIAGFDHDDQNKNVELQGVISAETTLQLKCYYVRECFSIYIDVNNADYGSVNTNAFINVKFGTPITISNNVIYFRDNALVATHKAWTTTTVYNFIGWTGVEEGSVSSDLNITAKFETGVRYYTILFKQNNIILQTLLLEYNQIPEFTQKTPTKPNSSKFTYTFDGWSVSGEDDLLQELPPATENITYVAHFVAQKIVDNSPNTIVIIVAVGLGIIAFASVSIVVVFKFRKNAISKKMKKDD